ncbi:hypothetical protein [Vibrio breoganii]|uniref:hypothetical protein n=1 Tax=Vibrio breoganii TaxID=553239 RepID=UPI000C865DBC|nr:hypothetical protein [Vibrio breoganii]PMK31614.1 hypothetical protein BCU03_07045 [Vibrio breoganii]
MGNLKGNGLLGDIGMIELTYPSQTLELMYFVPSVVKEALAPTGTNDSVKFVEDIASAVNIPAVLADKCEKIDIEVGELHIILNFSDSMKNLANTGFSVHAESIEKHISAGGPFLHCQLVS